MAAETHYMYGGRREQIRRALPRPIHYSLLPLFTRVVRVAALKRAALQAIRSNTVARLSLIDPAGGAHQSTSCTIHTSTTLDHLRLNLEAVRIEVQFHILLCVRRLGARHLDRFPIVQLA